MTPANFSVRPRSRRRSVVAIVVLLTVVAIALYFIGKSTSKGGSQASPTQTPERPAVSFTLQDFKVVAEKLGTPPAGAAERTDLLAFFNDYYLKGFVDTSAWSDPTWATVASKFAPEVRERFTANSADLTIGEGRTEFTRVKPDQAILSLSVYYDKASKATFAVAVVRFEATATTRSKQPVHVEQIASYRLQREGTGWAIFSYQARQTQDSPSTSPSPSASAS